MIIHPLQRCQNEFNIWIWHSWNEIVMIVNGLIFKFLVFPWKLKEPPSLHMYTGRRSIIPNDLCSLLLPWEASKRRRQQRKKLFSWKPLLYFASPFFFYYIEGEKTHLPAYRGANKTDYCVSKRLKQYNSKISRERLDYNSSNGRSNSFANQLCKLGFY